MNDSDTIKMVELDSNHIDRCLQMYILFYLKLQMYILLYLKKAIY